MMILPLFSLASCGTPHLPVVESVPVFTDVSMQGLDEVVIKNMKELDLPGMAIGIVKDGMPYYARGYGWASLKDKKRVTASTTFHTASISKVFTALAIMRLRDAGKLHLEQTLIETLPDLTYANEDAGNITLRQLLNHTSGLPDVKGYDWSSGKSDDMALENYFKSTSLETGSSPGTKIQYSNLGYDLLGLVVAKVSGQSFEDYVAQDILRPAGMSVSDFRYFRLDSENTARPYTKNLLGAVVPQKVYPYNREHAPSSTLNASAEEMTYWMAGFLRRLPKEASLMEMTRPSTALADWIGLGFQRFKVKGRTGIGHFGGDRGFRSYLLLLPEEEIGIVVLGNCDYEEDFRQLIAGELLAQLLE
ncbi:serine hydrolase domain-containing protein [Neolewinella agarilytica]|uniref:CubicO group peptidase, beta-lactamase class C family n=1 Tax=Neolewinella agarilytica TaxID=478744 RepID=A0A1H9I5P9_9BACT|nr:serine hydrolase domain-containing protein [Neolewinella agarilytica]SEQ69909.1 CubicO group peptidase, beta-lactamase class C family [Neolewinella agarilytica]